VRRRLGRVAAGAAALASLGCTGNVVRSEALPEAPLAIAYLTSAQARERAELLRKQRGERDAPETVQGTPVLDLNAVQEYLDGFRGPRSQRDLQGRVALLHPRTGRVEVLEAFLPGALPMAWSRDHRRLLVVSPRGGSPQLYELVLEGPELRPLTRGRRARLAGSYGPDGRLAWVEMDRRGRNLQLTTWVTEAGGIRPRRVSDGPLAGGVVWSPDGRWLHWESRRGRVPVIMALDLESQGQVPFEVARGAEPAFAPGGEWVVFSRHTRDGWRLWRMRPDGSGKTAVGAGRRFDEAEERHPAVSPDGRFVAYVLEEDDRQRLRVRRMDGTGDTLLLEDGDAAAPVW